MPDSLPTPATDTLSPTASVGEAAPSQNPMEENWRSSFWALIVTQFQGAFSANVLRYLLSFLVLGMALNDARRDTLVSLITLLFFVPLILFSMAGGYFAGRLRKNRGTIFLTNIQ